LGEIIEKDGWEYRVHKADAFNNDPVWVETQRQGAEAIIKHQSEKFPNIQFGAPVSSDIVEVFQYPSGLKVNHS